MISPEDFGTFQALEVELLPRLSIYENWYLHMGAAHTAPMRCMIIATFLFLQMVLWPLKPIFTTTPRLSTISQPTHFPNKPLHWLFQFPLYTHNSTFHPSKFTSMASSASHPPHSFTIQPAYQGCVLLSHHPVTCNHMELLPRVVTSHRQNFRKRLLRLEVIIHIRYTSKPL